MYVDNGKLETLFYWLRPFICTTSFSSATSSSREMATQRRSQILHLLQKGGNREKKPGNEVYDDVAEERGPWERGCYVYFLSALLTWYHSKTIECMYGKVPKGHDKIWGWI